MLNHEYEKSFMVFMQGKFLLRIKTFLFDTFKILISHWHLYIS